MSTAKAVKRYLRTGESDPMYSSWPVGLLERATRGDEELLGALVEEVKRRAAGHQDPAVPELDFTSWSSTAIPEEHRARLKDTRTFATCR